MELYRIRLKDRQVSRPERKQYAALNEKRRRTKMLMTVKTRELNHKNNIIREMAETGTERLHVCAGKVGDIAVGLGGTLVSPPLDVDHV